MAEVAIVNRSSLPDVKIAFAAEACDIQLREQFLAAWPGVPYTPVRFYADVVDLPVAADLARLMVVSDTIDFQGALGVHLFDGLVHGVVLNQGPPTSVTLSHEVLEMAADPLCVEWRDMPDGRQCALEVCDPVQQDSYPIAVEILGIKRWVDVAKFVTPDWFDASKPGAFELAEGGYMIVRGTDGHIKDEWNHRAREKRTGRAYQSPERERKIVNPTSRTRRRGVS